VSVRSESCWEEQNQFVHNVLGLKSLTAAARSWQLVVQSPEFEVRTQVRIHLLTSGADDLLPTGLSNFVTGRDEVRWGCTSAHWMIDDPSAEIGINFPFGIWNLYGIYLFVAGKYRFLYSLMILNAFFLQRVM